MKSFFSYESPVTQFILKLASSCCLNMLWLFCSIPIVTIGAATTALYSVSVKLVRDEEGAIVRQFFQSFRANFKQATQLWLILLVTGSFLAVDGYVVYHLMRASSGSVAVLWTVLLAIIIVAAIVYVVVSAFCFPLLSYFENTNRAMLLNSFLVGIRYLFCSILIIAIHFVMLWAIINLFTPLIIFGEGLCAFCSSYLLSNVFYALSGQTREKPSDSDELAAEEHGDGEQ